MTPGSYRSKECGENPAQQGEILQSVCATVDEFERSQICRTVSKDKRDSKPR